MTVVQLYEGDTVHVQSKHYTPAKIYITSLGMVKFSGYLIYKL